MILHSEIQRVLNEPRVILSPRSAPYFIDTIIRREAENMREIQTGETDETNNSDYAESTKSKSTQNSSNQSETSDFDGLELTVEN